ncbi:MAG: hypothetical protein H0Z33_12265 [Bacillaceae bacterium]|nr:hypothetical protein [Bacillaceae bacterium]
MNIGVDIDGTIKRTQEAAIAVFNEELGRDISLDDIQEFYLDKAYGLTAQEGRKLWRKLEHKIYQRGVPLEGAAHLLTELDEQGHTIYYITARPGKPHLKEITRAWLIDYGFPFRENRLHMNAWDKAEVARKLAIDLFFEDAPQHIERLTEKGIPTIVVDAVYNQGVHPELPRISDWHDVREYLAEHHLSL